ncbi:Predicted arabinose efflux permease, MFS family [Beijerinckia sp. 28-YEA-48]|nr:Predicted arabinose efflux permease, MFS family [Beijerinckia sp. 28-YEA-48]
MEARSSARLAQFALSFGLTINTTGQSFLLVVLPPLGRSLGFSDIQTGGILSISALLLMASAPVWGYLSERIGRRPVLLTALAGAAIAAALFGLLVHLRLAASLSAALTLGLFICVRAAQSLASSGILPASQAYMADITIPAQRTSAMGILGAAMGLGAILGAALAWQIAPTSPGSAFAIVCGLAVAAFASVFFLAREPARVARETSVEARLPLARIAPLLLITVASISAYSVLQQVTALRLQDALGFTVEESIARGGAALMATAMAMIAVQLFVVRLLRWEPVRLLGVGAAIAAISLLICSLVDSYAAIFGTLVMLGVGLGLMLPGNLAFLSLSTGAGAQGKAAGVNVLAQGLGQAIGPLAGAALHRISPQVPFLTATALLVLCCAVAIFIWRASVCRKDPRSASLADGQSR